MADDQSQQSKTEAPTAKKLEDAAKRGELAKSQDIPVWFVSVALAILAAMAFEPFCAALLPGLRSFIERPHDFIIGDAVMARSLLLSIGSLIWPLFLVWGVLCLVALTGHLAQHRPVWAVEKLLPSMERLSPAKNFSRLFGINGLVNLGKSILKLVAVSAAVFFALWPQLDVTSMIGLLTPELMAVVALDIARRLFLAAMIGIGAVAIIDYMWQRHSFMRKMSMSRRDIKDETKQAEGDPQIKARLREIRQQRARNRMMAAVPEATVVISNPTHYAVALQYQPEQKTAPICVALGVDELALRIRQTAEQAGVPIVENPPLARSLHAGSDLGEPIPVEHYQAVARIISFVMGTKKQKI